MEVFAMKKGKKPERKKTRGCNKIFHLGAVPILCTSYSPPHANLLYIFYFLDGIMCTPSPYKYVLKKM